MFHSHRRYGEAMGNERLIMFSAQREERRNEIVKQKLGDIGQPCNLVGTRYVCTINGDITGQ